MHEVSDEFARGRCKLARKKLAEVASDTTPIMMKGASGLGNALLFYPRSYPR
jgi:hypothetical protein